MHVCFTWLCRVQAPVIVVPQHSRSQNAIVADLGRIVVHNNFTAPGKFSDTGMPAVIDNMRIQLLQLKIARFARPDSKLRFLC